MSQKCIHCEEEFVTGDKISTYANGPEAHYACFMRAIVGSVGHQQKLCSCYVPGATDGDPEGMTRREAAELALAYWEEQNKGGCAKRWVN